jgi:hypothetical protein
MTASAEAAAPDAAAGNLARVKHAYQRWNDEKGGNVEHWFDLLDDNVEFRSLGAGGAGLEFTRVCGCKDDVRRYFAGLAQDWEMQHFTPKTFIADKDWVVMLGECAFKHRGSGKIFATPKADFLRFENGRAVEVQEFFDTAGAYAATQA